MARMLIYLLFIFILILCAPGKEGEHEHQQKVLAPVVEIPPHAHLVRSPRFSVLLPI